MGYPFAKKGYKLYNMDTKSCFISRDVFHEHIFPFHSSNSASSPTSFPTYFDFFENQVSPSSFTDIPSPSTSPDEFSHSSPDSFHSSFPRLPPFSIIPPLRVSSRHHKKPAYLQSYVCASLGDSSSPSQHLVFERHSYSQVAYIPEWQAAIRKEFEALEGNNTWNIVELPVGKKPIGCKLVYKLKYKVDGSLDRHKPRLVVRGDTQVQGINFHENFSPIVKMSSIKSLIAVAIKHHWFLYQLDVNNACSTIFSVFKLFTPLQVSFFISKSLFMICFQSFTVTFLLQLSVL